MTADLLIEAISVSIAPTLAVIVSGFIAASAARQAQRDAASAADRLIVQNKLSTVKLEQIAQTGEATHKIVNNQRTVMLNVIAALSERIAALEPDNEAAQKAAELARKDANTSVV